MSSSEHGHAQAYALCGSSHGVVINTAEASIMTQTFQKNKPRSMELSVMGQELEELQCK